MKFNISGGLHAPDWVLAESSLLVHMSDTKVRHICNTLITSLLEEDEVLLQMEHVKSTASDLKAVVAILNYFITNACKYNVPPEIMVHELQQIGIGISASGVIVDCVTESKKKVRTFFAQKSLQCGYRLSQNTPLHWRANIIADSKYANKPCATIELNIPVTDRHSRKTSIAFEVGEEKLRLIFSELSKARDKMNHNSVVNIKA